MTVFRSLRTSIDELDLSPFQRSESGGMSEVDRRSLLGLHAAVAARGDFTYLEIGSYLGASLQSFVADARCRMVISVDCRDEVSADERAEVPRYPQNTTAEMLARLSSVPGADLEKLTAIDGTTEELNPENFCADLCLIDAEHTNEAVLQDARFCRKVIRDHGVIIFHDRTLVSHGIFRFLGELQHYRAYPMANDLFVVELNIPSLLSDPRVKAQVLRQSWLLASQIGAIRPMLLATAKTRRLGSWAGRTLLRLGAPRRSGTRVDAPLLSAERLFEVYSFADDDRMYAQMLKSFIDAGFEADAFVRLEDAQEDPYAAITRLGRSSLARYPILCHQDVLLDRGANAIHLARELAHLDEIDPGWVVAGSAGVTRDGCVLGQFVNPIGDDLGPSPSAYPVVTLDEHLLVFNRRNAPRCSDGLAGFHLYGTDACLQALSTNGSAYVINFPLTHLSRGRVDGSYEQARDRLAEAWRPRCLFRYVASPCGTLFISRSRLLRYVFGSSLAMTCVGYCQEHRYPAEVVAASPSTDLVSSPTLAEASDRTVRL
jgi:hypothetical protein